MTITNPLFQSFTALEGYPDGHQTVDSDMVEVKTGASINHEVAPAARDRMELLYEEYQSVMRHKARISPDAASFAPQQLDTAPARIEPQAAYNNVPAGHVSPAHQPRYAVQGDLLDDARRQIDAVHDTHGADLIADEPGLGYAAYDAKTAPVQEHFSQRTDVDAVPAIDPNLRPAEQFFLQDFGMTPRAMDTPMQPAAQPAEAAPWNKVGEATEFNPVPKPGIIDVLDDLQQNDVDVAANGSPERTESDRMAAAARAQIDALHNGGRNEYERVA